MIILNLSDPWKMSKCCPTFKKNDKHPLKTKNLLQPYVISENRLRSFHAKIYLVT